MNSAARRPGTNSAARLRTVLKSRLTSSFQNCRAIAPADRQSVSASRCPHRWQYGPASAVPQLLQIASVTRRLYSGRGERFQRRRRMLRSSLVGIVLCAGVLSTPVRAQDAASEAAIRAIVAEQAAAWNAGDGATYSRQIAPDVSFTNLFGMVMYGKAPFMARHSEILTTFYKGTT